MYEKFYACLSKNRKKVINPFLKSNLPLPDRAAIKLHINAAPIYNRRISSAYALSDFDSTIVLDGWKLLYISDWQHMQFIAIDLSVAYESKYICGTQETAFGGRGIIATALLTLVIATSSNIKMDFDSVVLNMMALLLSFNDLDCREDGIAVIELGDLYFLTARFGEQPRVHYIIALYNYGYHLRLVCSVTMDGC